MPEGPECYKYARSLDKTLAGKHLVGVHILGGRYAKHGQPDGLANLEAAIVGADTDSASVAFVEVKSKGKLIYFNLSNQMTILSTLGLMGKWTRTKCKHCGIAVEYRGGGDKGSNMIYFKDQIHYGTLSVINTTDLPKKLKTLGIDVLDRDSFTWDAFLVRARRNAKNTLPVFLMKQNVLCGIGNYLKAEIIYASRSSLTSPIADYTDAQLRRVYDACYTIPYQATFGKFSLCVYNRSRDRLGNKVYTAKTPDKRTTYWVPAVCPIDIKTDCPAAENGWVSRMLGGDGDDAAASSGSVDGSDGDGEGSPNVAYRDELSNEHDA